MNYVSNIITYLLLIVILPQSLTSMTTRSSQLLKKPGQLALANKQIQKRSLIQQSNATASPSKNKSYWESFKALIFGNQTHQTTPLVTNYSINQHSYSSYWAKIKNALWGENKVAKPTFQERENYNSITTDLEKVTTPSQAEKLLADLTETAFYEVKITSNTSSDDWTNLIKKTDTAITFIQQNCFTKTHPNALHDNDIPQEIYDPLFDLLKAADINPASISILYRDTIDVDPFGHETISVMGPTITYKNDMNSQNNVITGYEPAQITLHKQNITQLTKNQFKAKVQHSITHLKEAHNEQLGLLKEAIGKEKYQKFTAHYKNALETTADFAQPIKNSDIAKTVQQAFLDEALDVALKEIKSNRKKQELENSETALTICTPPGNGPKILASIASFDDLNKYLEEKEKELYKKLTHSRIVTLSLNRKDNDFVFRNFMTKKEKANSFIDSVAHQKAIPNVIHDSANLSPFIINEAKRLLTEANINPNSIHILAARKLNEQEVNQFKKFDSIFADFGSTIEHATKTCDTAQAVGSILFGDEYSLDTIYSPPVLIFNQEELAKLSHQEVIFIIAHEIGHLLNKDTMTAILLANLKVTSKSVIEEYYQIIEVKADITYAQKNPSLAKVIYKNYLQKFSSQNLYTGSFELDPYESYYTHPSFMDRYHWIKKIIELHQKEDSRQIAISPTFAVEKE